MSMYRVLTVLRVLKQCSVGTQCVLSWCVDECRSPVQNKFPCLESILSAPVSMKWYHGALPEWRIAGRHRGISMRQAPCHIKHWAWKGAPCTYLKGSRPSQFRVVPPAPWRQPCCCLLLCHTQPVMSALWPQSHGAGHVAEMAEGTSGTHNPSKEPC